MTRVEQHAPALWGDAYSRAANARPFLKWAGGKGRFLQLYGRRLPSFTGKYLEPFLGGGSVFFHLVRSEARPFEARLGDVNAELIRTYIEVQKNPHALIEQLRVLQAGYTASSRKSDYYYEMRDRFNASRKSVEAGLFIFLNQTCWNGLWRVNSNGQFNVPFGGPKNDEVVPGAEAIYDASAALAKARLRITSWQNTLAMAQQGDFVFLDPPYYSELKAKDGLATKYQAKVFSARDHRRLAQAVRDLADRGIAFVLTNSADPEMQDLYSSLGFNVEVIEIARSINSRADERTRAPELVITASPLARTPQDEQHAALLDLEARALAVRRRRAP